VLSFALCSLSTLIHGTRPDYSTYISGIGPSLGVGIYVVTSYAIGKEAGPSCVISVIIAGVATLLAGIVIYLNLFHKTYLVHIMTC